MNTIIMNKYLVSEYYYEDDLFSVLEPKSYQTFNEIIQMISNKYSLFILI